MKFFNTEGPMKPEIHYTIPPLSRWNLDDLLTLIARQKYFVVHAPRQTGPAASGPLSRAGRCGGASHAGDRVPHTHVRPRSVGALAF